VVKSDSSLSTPESVHNREIENKTLETTYLQQIIERKNQEISLLQHEIKRHKKKSLFSAITQKIKKLIKRESEENVYLNRRNPYIVKYPEEVIIKASQLFDKDWYLDQYPEVKISGADPAAHYLQFGIKYGYDPSPHFSTRDYQALYPDAQKMNPLVHYELFGKAEGRKCRIADKASSQQETLANNKIKITFISGEPETPGHFYRISHYANAARIIGAEIMEMDVASAFANLEQITGTTILFVWRAGWSQQISHIFTVASKAKVPIVFDVDDLMVDAKLAKVKIVDGIRTIGSTEQQVEKFFKAMQLSMHFADYCSAPTTFLADYVRAYDKKTFVLPNGFDEYTWHASRLAMRTRFNSQHDGLIRIGYAGGSRTHQKDFSMIVDVIARILRERPHCRLVLFRKGTTHCIDIDEFPALLPVSQQIEWREMVPLKELPWEMARFDINIAPLEFGNPFCEAKSELKFFESALVEVPVVASPTQPFRDAIIDGKTGFLAYDEESWYSILSKLLDDSALRKQIGRHSYYSVLWKYGSERRVELISSMMEMILFPGVRAARTFELGLLKSKNDCFIMPIIPPHEVIISHQKLNVSEVTVVVPSYNYGHFLIEALESVKDQTLLNIDLVIVDDCSTDNSIELALKWINKHKGRFNRVVLLKNTGNSGLALTRNVGFFHSESLFVIPLDPDNKLLPNFAIDCLTKIKESGAAFVYPNIQRFGDDDKVIGVHSYDPMRLVNGNYIDAMALIRLSAWAYVGGYQHLKFGWEDYDLWCRFIEHGLVGEHIDEILAKYRVHNQSMLNQVTNRTENKSKVKADIQSRHPWLRQAIKNVE